MKQSLIFSCLIAAAGLLSAQDQKPKAPLGPFSGKAGTLRVMSVLKIGELPISEGKSITIQAQERFLPSSSTKEQFIGISVEAGPGEIGGSLLKMEDASSFLSALDYLSEMDKKEARFKRVFTDYEYSEKLSLHVLENDEKPYGYISSGGKNIKVELQDFQKVKKLIQEAVKQLAAPSSPANAPRPAAPRVVPGAPAR